MHHEDCFAHLQTTQTRFFKRTTAPSHQYLYLSYLLCTPSVSHQAACLTVAFQYTSYVNITSSRPWASTRSVQGREPVGPSTCDPTPREGVIPKGKETHIRSALCIALSSHTNPFSYLKITLRGFCPKSTASPPLNRNAVGLKLWTAGIHLKI